MKHEIDLKNYQIHTDLAIEDLNLKNLGITNNIKDNIKITSINVDDDKAKELQKKKGNYITIEFKDASDYQNIEELTNIFQEELLKLLKINNVKDNDSCMIIGLGNRNSTPDSLGPLVIDNILVTNHLYLFSNIEEGFRRTYAISPGVMGETGMETSDILNSIVKEVKPNFLIVIDSLASGSIDRLNKTIQITDTGINPGSGIGNNRKEISKETLNIPVIAVGVPTILDAVTIVSDTINYICKNYAYMKNNKNNLKNKLIPSNKINYLEENYDLEEKEKKNLLGIIGELNDEEIKELIYEVLTPIGYNLMVTPKEIDFVIKKISEVISNGINYSLHKILR